MYPKTLSLFLLSFVFLTVSTVTNANTKLDSITAIVNHDIITTRMVNAQLNAVKQQMVQQKTPLASDKALRKKALDLLIDQSLQLQVAKKANITATKADVANALERIASSQQLTPKQILASLKTHNISQKTFLDNLHKQIIIKRVQQQFIANQVRLDYDQLPIIEKKIRKELSHKKVWQYHVQEILLPLPSNPSQKQMNQVSQQAQILISQLNRGKAFNLSALAQSIGQMILLGGDLGWKTAKELSPIYAQNVVHMQEGQVAGPMRGKNGVNIIRLVGKREVDAKQELDEKELKARAKNVLYQRQFQKKLNTWLSQLRASAYIEIK